jgi:hypothetical protein
MGVSPASAKTSITAPPGTSMPYQRWVDEAKAPTPNVTLTLVEDDAPCGGPTACTGPGDFTIWLAPWGGEGLTRGVFLHELGHNFDYYDMTEATRAHFEFLVGEDRSWTEDPNAPNEKFAEAWKWCALKGTNLRRAPLNFSMDYRPTPKLQPKVCALIKKAAHGSGSGISK